MPERPETAPAKAGAASSRLRAAYKRDLETGEGKAPLLIKDLKGGLLYSSEEAWITMNISWTSPQNSSLALSMVSFGVAPVSGSS